MKYFLIMLIGRLVCFVYLLICISIISLQYLVPVYEHNQLFISDWLPMIMTVVTARKEKWLSFQVKIWVYT